VDNCTGVDINKEFVIDESVLCFVCYCVVYEASAWWHFLMSIKVLEERTKVLQVTS
jgi:hypothetical protein